MSVSAVGHSAAQTAHQSVKPQAPPPKPPAAAQTTQVKTGGVNKLV